MSIPEIRKKRRRDMLRQTVVTVERGKRRATP